jgi:5-deoxy-glucuronate isomerase
LNLIASPENSPLRWQSFGLINLPGKGSCYEGRLGQEEGILTLIQGQGTVEIQERSGENLRFAVGPRRDPFSEKATLVCLQPGTAFRVTAEGPEFRAAFHRTHAAQEGKSFLIKPEALTPTPTGVGNWHRQVCLCSPLDQPFQRFLIGETINPPGNWASYPPHKHDEDQPPYEAPYEEVYHFLMKPKQGFGFIRVYEPKQREDPIDKAFVIEHGDTVVLPKGYHPLTVAPGYQLLYIFSLVGEKREYGAWSDDPDHQWVRACEAVVKGLG